MYVLTDERRRKNFGRSRSQQTENLRKEWGGHGGLDDKSLDQCKFLEKKIFWEKGRKAASYLRHADVRGIK